MPKKRLADKFKPSNTLPNGVPLNASGAYANLTNETEIYFFNHYYYQLYLYAVNMFEWKNLPDDIPSKFIEQVLVTNGMGAFGEYFGKLAFMRCNLLAPFDIYFEPKNIEMYAIEGVQLKKNKDNSVVVYNNYLRQPTSYFLETYAARMAHIEAFIKVNINSNKTPYFITAQNANQRLTIENAYAKIENNKPVIITLDGMSIADDIKVLNTNSNWLVEQAQNYKQQTWDEAMEFLGVRNVFSDKRERLVTAEADGNIQQIELSRKTMLNARKDACEKVNKMFGTNIDVEFSLITNYGNGLVGHILDDELLEEVKADGSYNATDATSRDNESGQS